MHGGQLLKQGRHGWEQRWAASGGRPSARPPASTLEASSRYIFERFRRRNNQTKPNYFLSQTKAEPN